MYAEDMDFNAINQLHTALIKMYGGIYPLDEILRNVSLHQSDLSKFNFQIYCFPWLLAIYLYVYMTR